MSYSVSQDPTLWPGFCSSPTGSFLFPWNTRLLLPQELCPGLFPLKGSSPSLPSVNLVLLQLLLRQALLTTWCRVAAFSQPPPTLWHSVSLLFSIFFLLYLIFLTFLLIASFLTSSLWILPLENKFCEEKEFYSIHYGISRTYHTAWHIANAQ